MLGPIHDDATVNRRPSATCPSTASLIQHWRTNTGQVSHCCFDLVTPVTCRALSIVLLHKLHDQTQLLSIDHIIHIPLKHTFCKSCAHELSVTYCHGRDT